MDVLCGNVVLITSFIFAGAVARSLQSFFNLQSLIVPYQKSKPPEQKKGTNLFTLSATGLNDKTVYVERTTASVPLELEHRIRGYTKQVPLVHFYNQSFIPQVLPMPWMSSAIYPYQAVNPMVPTNNLPSTFQLQPFTQMPLYPYNVMPKELIVKGWPYYNYGLQGAVHSIDNYLSNHVPVLPVYNYFSRTKNDVNTDNYRIATRNALYPSQNNPESKIPYYTSEEDWNKYERNLKNKATAKTTLKPAKSTQDFMWTKFKQNPAEQFAESKLKIPTNLYKSNSEEQVIHTKPISQINKLHMNAQENILLNSLQNPRSFIKQKSYPGTMLMPQVRTVPGLFGPKSALISNPMVAPSYPYIAQMNPNLVNPFLFSFPLIGYGYPNGMPNIPPMDPMGNPYVISQIPSIPYNTVPILPAHYMPANKEMEERKHLLNLIDGNPDGTVDANAPNNFQFTPPLMNSYLSENIKAKRQNELSVVNKISALKAKIPTFKYGKPSLQKRVESDSDGAEREKTCYDEHRLKMHMISNQQEQLAEMNRRALFQKAKAADEEYVRKLNKELNLITEWKLANLSAEEAFQKLMANKRQLSEQECEVHRVKEAENELYGELLQSQAELAIADMQLIPSIPSEVILRQFLSGMNYDRPMDIPPAV